MLSIYIPIYYSQGTNTIPCNARPYHQTDLDLRTRAYALSEVTKLRRAVSIHTHDDCPQLQLYTRPN
jgi:hypothetical protein